MTLLEFLVFLALGALAGWLAGLATRGAGLGLTGNLLVGVLVALATGMILDRLHVATLLATPAVLFIAFVGTALALAALNVMRRTAT